MPLLCYCEYDPEPGDVLYYSPDDYSTFDRPRRVRCSSCKELISQGDTVLEFSRCKVPGDEVELAIYGEEGEIPMASHFMCERCSDLFWSLRETYGYQCIAPEENMLELAKECAAIEAADRVRVDPWARR